MMREKYERASFSDFHWHALVNYTRRAETATATATNTRIRYISYHIIANCCKDFYVGGPIHRQSDDLTQLSSIISMSLRCAPLQWKEHSKCVYAIIHLTSHTATIIIIIFICVSVGFVSQNDDSVYKCPEYLTRDSKLLAVCVCVRARRWRLFAYKCFMLLILNILLIFRNVSRVFFGLLLNSVTVPVSHMIWYDI